MKTETSKMDNENQVKKLLIDWETATRTGKDDAVLCNHAADLLIFDVLAPLQYKSAAAYRKSWEEWRPKDEVEPLFKMHELKITTGETVAFALCLIECGQKPNVDWVRATFCLTKTDGEWIINHQHSSMPIGK